MVFQHHHIGRTLRISHHSTERWNWESGRWESWTQSHNRTITLGQVGPLDTITLSFPACVTLHPADSPLDVSSEKLLRLFCFVTLCLLEKPGRVTSVPAIGAVKLTQGCHVKPKQLKWIQEGRTIKIDIFRSYLWIWSRPRSCDWLQLHHYRRWLCKIRGDGSMFGSWQKEAVSDWQ